MKTAIITACILFAFVTVAFGQDTLKIQGSEKRAVQKLRPIDVRELPGPIKKKISGEDYSSWILQRAYETDGRSNGQPADSLYYVVELRKGNETIRLWFDEEGHEQED